MLLWQLFWSFFKLGLISFGGGYAMIPVIQHEVLSKLWMSESRFADAIALAGMAPGPIATNSAIYIGYQVAGLPGSMSATVGIVLPSIIIIVLISSIFYKVYERRWVKSVFYGLKPTVAALIFFAAIRLAMANPILHGSIRNAVVSFLMFITALLAISYFKKHPLSVIVMSGLVGIAVYG